MNKEDAFYHVIALLYHSLREARRYGQYLRKNENVANDDLRAFFQEAQDANLMRAERAKRLLAQLLQEEIVEIRKDPVDVNSEESFPASDPPPHMSVT